MILGRAFMPDATLGAPRYLSLLSPGGWSLYGLAAVALLVVFPLLHLTVPADSALHISDYWVTLIGKM
jgi:urea transport system permease protein